MPMKVWIDQDLCTGDGLCEEIAPAVFTLLDDGLAYVKDGGDGERHAGDRAAGVDQGGARVAGPEVAGQDEHLAPGLLAVVEVAADGGDDVAHLVGRHGERPAARVAEHGAGVTDVGAG